MLGPDGSSGGGEKGSDSGHIVEVRPTRFSDGWGIRCEGNRNQEQLSEWLVGHWRWRRLQGEQVWNRKRGCVVLFWFEKPNRHQVEMECW